MRMPIRSLRERLDSHAHGTCIARGASVQRRGGDASARTQPQAGESSRSSAENALFASRNGAPIALARRASERLLQEMS
jgi:hypothetical protein